MVTFKNVPDNIRTRTTAIEFDPTLAAAGLAVKPLRALLIGGRLAAGTVAELTPTRVTSANEVAALCGNGSTLHGMAQRWFKNGGAQIETWFCSLNDDGSGQQNVRTITLGGAQTAAGTIYLYVAGRRLRIPVSADTVADTLTALALRVRDAINAMTELPCTASASAAVVTVTAKNDGETGANIDYRVNYGEGETLPPGLTVVVAQVTAGSNNPDIAQVWPVIGDTQYDVIVSAYADASNYGDLDAELERRWGPIQQNDGFGFIGIAGAFGTITAYSEPKNSKHISLIPARSPLNPPWEWAGAFAAVSALALQGDPAANLAQREVQDILAPRLADRWTWDERNQLLFAGASTWTINANGRVMTDQIVTVYQRNEVGAEDPAFYFASHHAALSYIRYAWRTRLDTKFVSAKLSGDENAAPGPGQQLVTPDVLKAEAVAFAAQLAEAGIIQDVEGFRTSLVAELNPSNGNRVDMVMSPKLIGYLTVTATRIALRVS